MTVQEVKEVKNRVPTGIVGLDDMIEGGFPRNSLMLLAGSPGSGKTIASAQFLYYGASDLNENGVYVSFAERKEFFFDNMKRFGLDFENLENQGKFKFLDLMATNEAAVSSTLNVVLREVVEMNAKRLVIDSFTAMAQAFKRKIDARIILQFIDKIMRQTGCTTLAIVELPTGSLGIGFGFEEFVVDGIILFQTIEEREGIRKRAVILKMRGTSHSHNYYNIVISKKGISLMPYVT
jgi:circadian clock protein KaiC